MKRSFLIILIVLPMVCFALSAEENSYPTDYLLSYPATIYTEATAPLNWQKANWLQASVIILTAGSLYFLDDELRELYQRNRTEFTDNIFTGAKQCGEVKIVLPALAITTLGGYLAQNEKITDTGLLCLKSSVLALSVTQILKMASQRQRPLKDQGEQFWNGSKFSFHNDSFPSGHSTLVWSIAPIIAEANQPIKWIPPTVYVMATLTSLSRLNDDQHWTSDVFTGAVIGYVTAKLTLKTTPHWQLSYYQQGQGVSVLYRF
ncbi:MAG: phosphatase PAP2 family protein [Candidatus Cloacimonas sp.]